MSRWTKILLFTGACAVLLGSIRQTEAGRYGGIRGSRFPSYRKASSSPSYHRTQSPPPVAPPPPARPVSPPPVQPAPAAQPQAAPQPTTAVGQERPAGDIETPATSSTTTNAPEPTALEMALQVLDRVGSWVAQHNGQTVQFQLRPDGTFKWTNIREGKPTSFAGTYTIDGQRLTLTYGNQKQLRGTMTSVEDGFQLQFDNAKLAALKFARQ